MAKPRATANTRERILDATEAMLLERGFMGISLEEVAQRVGIRKASLYYHFPDGKEQICLQLTQRMLDHHHRDLTGALGNAPDHAAQLEVIAHWAASVGGGTELLLRDAMRFMTPEHQAIISGGFVRQVFAPIHEVFTRAASSGEFALQDPEFAAWAFLGMVTELSNRPGGALGLERQSVDLFLNGLRPRPPQRA